MQSRMFIALYKKEKEMKEGDGVCVTVYLPQLVVCVCANTVLCKRV